MFDALINQIAELLGTYLVDLDDQIREDHRANREKVTDYARRVEAERVAGELGARTVAVARRVYQERLSHGRLGHESLSAELKASDVSFQKANVRVSKSPTIWNVLLSTAATLRLQAIAHVVGAECIRTDANGAGGDVAGDGRMTRRAIRVDDVPADALPLVALLGEDGEERHRAIEALASMRAMPTEAMGTVAKIVALAASPQHRAAVAALAGDVGDALEGGEAVPREAQVVSATSRPAIPSASDARPVVVFGSNFAATTSENRAAGARENAAAVATDPTDAPATVQDRTEDAEGQQDIRRVEAFCSKNPWSIVEDDGFYSLQELRHKHINAAFERVADSRRMQLILRDLYAERKRGDRLS